MSKKFDKERFLKPYRAFKGPAWRRDLAGKLPPDRMHHLVREAESDVRDVHHFRLLCERGKSGKARAEALYPAIAAAYVFNLDEAKCAAAKILTVGGCDRSEIAARLGVDERILAKWESLFFDVRESRHAVGWIHQQVIQPERDRGRSSLASKMKAAFSRGPIVARALLDLEDRAPVTAGEKLFDRDLTLHLKFDRAAALPMRTNRERLFFMRYYAELLLQETKLRLAEKKFEQRCAEALDKQAQAKIRLEMAEKHAAKRRADRARRQHERELAEAARERKRAVQAARQQALLRAEWEAAAARAAASPLSALTWGSGTSSTVSSEDKTLSPPAEIESVHERVMIFGEEAEGGAPPVGEDRWTDCIEDNRHLAEVSVRA